MCDVRNGSPRLHATVSFVASLLFVFLPRLQEHSKESMKNGNDLLKITSRLYILDKRWDI